MANKFCCGGESLPSHSNDIETLIRQLKKEVKTLMETTEAKLLCQTKKIDELIVYIKNNLSESLQSLLNDIVESGQLDDIIGTSLNDLQYQINNDNIYYSEEINTVKKYDEEAQTDYYVTYIPPKAQNGDDLRLTVGIANDNLNFNTVESTVHFAHRKNATICINGGYFYGNTENPTNNPIGIVIKDGEILYNKPTTNQNVNYCCFKKDGTLVLYPYDTLASDMILYGVQQCIAGTTVLIKDNQAPSLEVLTKEPRQAIGQRANGTIVIVSVDGRDLDDLGMTHSDLQRIMINENCINAINLDGGGSTSTVLRGIKQNESIDDWGAIDREVSNFLYITKPTSYDPNQIVSKSYEAIGDLKEELVKMIVNAYIFRRGYIKLMCKEGFKVPGVEAYSDGSPVRTGKIGFNDINNFFVTLLNEDTQSEDVVFKADKTGLYSKDGKLANLFSYLKRVPDNNCNITGEPMSIYYSFPSDTNAPDPDTNTFIVHIPYTSNLNVNIRQISIPLGDKENIKMRVCNSSGVWGDWYTLGISRGYTANRPLTPSIGEEYFDMTIDKPIWYDGSKWIDATGTQV